ncbi:MAG: hypothetical protein U1E10_06690 [Bdellovibrionales bacterium]|jgi:hypothetical protein|nr:hypothetical protein [Bdellovibrionales bacterium]
MSTKPRFQELRDAIELADGPNILEQLVKYNSTVQTDQPSPVVDLLLVSGAVIRGTPFKMVYGNNRYLFAMQTFESTKDLPPTEVREITYIDSSHIVSLKIHEPLKWRHELSFGRAARPLNEEPLTRLNAKRLTLEDWSNARTEIPLQVDWDAIPQDGLENNHIRRLVKEVASVFHALKADALGMEALKAVKSLQIVYSKESVIEASLVEGGLRLTTDARGTNVTTANVRAAIEAAL